MNCSKALVLHTGKYIGSGCTTASFLRTARLNFLLLNSNSTMSVECTILHDRVHSTDAYDLPQPLPGYAS